MDVDECVDGVSPCSSNASCTNSIGSYSCECLDGYFGDGVDCYAPTLSPTSGPVGTELVIEGPGLGDEVGEVNFGGTLATVREWTDERIVVTVPEMPVGVLAVAVRSVEGAAMLNFMVTNPPVVYALAGTNVSGVGAIYLFDLDRAGGTLTPRPDPVLLRSVDPGWLGGCSEQLAVHRETRRLFATTFDRVEAFAIDSRTGALTPIAGGSVSVPGAAYGVSVNDVGNRIVVTSFSGSHLTVIDVAADGRLATTKAGSLTISAGATHTVFVSREDDFVYVNDVSGDAVLGCFVGTDGSLTELEGAPLAGTGGGGWTVLPRPGHDQIFVSEVTGFNVVDIAAADGEMSPNPGNPFSVAPVRQSFAFASDGNRLFATDVDGQVHVVDVDAGGTPTPINGSPFAFEIEGLGSACTRVSSDDRFLFSAVEEPSGIAVFELDPSGAVIGGTDPVAFPVDDASTNTIITAY